MVLIICFYFLVTVLLMGIQIRNNILWISTLMCFSKTEYQPCIIHITKDLTSRAFWRQGIFANSPRTTRSQSWIQIKSPTLQFIGHQISRTFTWLYTNLRPARHKKQILVDFWCCLVLEKMLGIYIYLTHFYGWLAELYVEQFSLGSRR